MNNTSTPYRLYWLVLLVVMVAAYFPLFLHLDAAPIRQWDESLFALRAFYLAEEGELLGNFNQIEACDFNHPNGKPPLVTLLQAGFFKIFGYTELALRLPVALFGLATVLYLLYFFKRHVQLPWLGVLSTLVLLTTAGYTTLHVSRTGDHDAAVAFFVLVAVTNFYRYLKHPERRRYLIICTLSIVAGFLTKSVVAFFTVPALLLYSWHQQQLKWLLTSKATYWAVAGAIAAIALAFSAIEFMNPGYLSHVWQHEIAGRYSETIHGHYGPWYYYLEQLATVQFTPWLFILPLLPLAFIWNRKKGEGNDLLTLILLAAVSYLLVISGAQTKLPWYLAGTLPLLAILAAAVLHSGLQWFWNNFRLPKPVLFSITAVLILFIFSWPYYRTLERITTHTPEHTEEQAVWLMKRNHRTRPEMKAYTLFSGRFFSGPLFYTNVWNTQQGFQIDKVSHNTPSAFSKRDTVLVCEETYKKGLREYFSFEILDSEWPCELVVLHSKPDS